jgi:hypothetical protein
MSPKCQSATYSAMNVYTRYGAPVVRHR